MGDNIKWLASLDDGINQANAQDKCILLDFFNPD
jgi:hypothetical protein